MENSALLYIPKLLLIGVGIAFILTGYTHLRRRFADREDRDEWVTQLLWPAAVMILALVANGLAFIGSAYIESVMMAQQGTWRPDGRMYPVLMVFAFWRGPLMVVVGTAGLCMVSLRAYWQPIQEGDTPKIASMRLQESIFRQLMTRHILAVLGIGTVFGVVGGPGPLLLLAAELVFMWVGSKFALAHMLNKHRQEM